MNIRIASAFTDELLKLAGDPPAMDELERKARRAEMYGPSKDDLKRSGEKLRATALRRFGPRKSSEDQGIYRSVAKSKGDWNWDRDIPDDRTSRIKDVRDRVRRGEMSKSTGDFLVSDYKKMQAESIEKYKAPDPKSDPTDYTPSTTDLAKAKLILDSLKARHKEIVSAGDITASRTAKNNLYDKRTKAREDVSRASDTSYVDSKEREAGYGERYNEGVSPNRPERKESTKHWQGNPGERYSPVHAAKQRERKLQGELDRAESLRVRLELLRGRHQIYVTNVGTTSVAKEGDPKEILTAAMHLRAQRDSTLPKANQPDVELYRKWTQGKASKGESTKLKNVAPKAYKEIQSEPETGKVPKQASVRGLLLRAMEAMGE